MFATMMLIVAVVALEGPARADVDVPDGYVASTIAVGMDDGRDIVATPDGRLLVALGDGDIRVIRDDVLVPTPLLSLAVGSAAQQGLHSLAIDDGFAEDGYVYVVFTPSGADINRLSRFTVSGDLADPASEVVLLDLPPIDGANSHYGAAVADAGDGTLLITVGDHESSGNGQDTTTRTGSVLRVTKDGSIPVDNPFVGDASVDDAIFAYGFRNPWQIAVSRQSGRIAVSDVGASSWEELDLVAAGDNHGWDDAEGPGGPGVEPLFAYPHFGLVPGAQFEGCAVTGSTFYEPDVVQLPSRLVGDLFVGDLCSGWINAVDPVSGLVESFATGFDSIADLATNPANGALYVLDRNLADGRSGVSKIEFVGDDVTLRITAQPTSQRLAIGQRASFFVAAVGQGDLQYQWQRDGVDIGGATDPLLKIPAVSPADDGARFRARITDDLGAITSSIAEIILTDNFAPVPSIAAPEVGSTYGGGQQILLRGSATDAEDGVLAPAALTWEVRLNHDEHDHGFTDEITGVGEATITVPASGETSPDVWYTVYLTAVDEDGATATVSRRIDPRLVELSFSTEPAGGVLNIDGPPQSTPYAVNGVEGIVRTVRAPVVQILAGTPHGFTSWSDGQSIEHDIVTPNDGIALTARYAPLPFDAAATPACAVVRISDAAVMTFSGPFDGSVNLRRGNSWLQTVTGLGYYVDADSPGPNATYTIRTKVGGTKTDIDCIAIAWPPDDPPPPQPGDITCTGTRTGTTVTLTFTGTDGLRTQLRRNGDWLATVTGLTTYTDTPAGTTYTLRTRPDGTITDTPCTGL